MLPNFNELLGSTRHMGYKNTCFTEYRQSTFEFLYSRKKLKTQEFRPNQQNNPRKQKKKMVLHLYISRNTEDKREKKG